MKTIHEILKSYGDYHRNAMNKLTHIIGVPMIVLAIMIPLNWIFLLWPVIVMTCFYYLHLSRRLGAILLVSFVLMGLFADHIAHNPDLQGWILFLVLFIGGWIIQFIGHGFEGKKPAFLDNILQMLSAPLFVTYEILSFLGIKAL